MNTLLGYDGSPDRGTLRRVLTVALSPDEMERWLADVEESGAAGDDGLRKGLPPPGGAHADRVLQVVDALERRRLFRVAVMVLLQTRPDLAVQLGLGVEATLLVRPYVPVSIARAVVEVLECEWSGRAASALRKELAAQLGIAGVGDAHDWSDAVRRLDPDQLVGLLEELLPEARSEGRRDVLRAARDALAGSHDLVRSDKALASRLQTELERCRVALKEDRFEEALEGLVGLEEQLNELVEGRIAQTDDLLRTRALLRVERANALLGLQDVEGAAALLQGLAPEQLKPAERARAARIALLAGAEHLVDSLLIGVPLEDQVRTLRLREVMGGAPLREDDYEEARAEASVVMARRGDWAGAAAEAMRMARSEEVLLQVRALELLAGALLVTQGLQGETRVPVEERRQVVLQARALFDELQSSRLPVGVRRWVLKAGERLARAEGRVRLLCSLRQELGDLAGEQGVPTDPGRPWLVMWKQAVEAHGAGDRGHAETLAQEVTVAVPDFMFGHYMLGELRFATGRPAEALDCLERARALLPVFCVEWLLARIHLALGRRVEAWSLLSELPDDGDLDVLWQVAFTAFTVASPDGPRRWTRVLEVLGSDHPRRGEALLGRAQALGALARYTEAARDASAALDAGLRTMSALGRVFLRHKQAGAETEALLRLAVRLVDHARQTEASALEVEQLSLELNAQLGFPDALPRPDYALLAEAGIVQSFSMEEGVSLIQSWVTEAAKAWQAFQAGLMDAYSFAALAGSSWAQVVERILAEGPMPAPRSSETALTSEVWIGAVEVLAFAALELLDPVDEAHPTVRWVMLQSDRLGIVQGDRDAHVRRQTAELQRQRALEQLLLGPGVELHKRDVHEADSALAAREGWCFVSPDAVGESWSGRGLAQWLSRVRVDLRIHIADVLPHLSGPTNMPTTELPATLLVSHVALQELHGHGLLDALVEAARQRGGRLVVGPEAWALQRRRIEELDSLERQAATASRALRWVEALRDSGRLELVEEELPEPMSPVRASLWRLEVRRRWLLGGEGRTAIAAEVWGTGDSLASLRQQVPIWEMMSEVDRGVVQNLMQSVLVDPQVTLAQVVLGLSEDRRRDVALGRLAAAGAVDVLDGARLVRLFERHGALTLPILERYGWSPRSLLARDFTSRFCSLIWVSRASLQATIRIWGLSGEEKHAEAARFTRELLGALWELEEAEPLVMVGRRALAAVAVLAGAAWRMGVERTDLLGDSDLASLWGALGAWANPSDEATIPGHNTPGSRAFVFQSVIIEQMLLARLPSGRTAVLVADSDDATMPVIQATLWGLKRSSRVVQEVAALLSAIDAVPALGGLSVSLEGPDGLLRSDMESPYVYAADLWARGEDGLSLEHTVLHGKLPSGFPVHVAIDAVWLRLPPDRRLPESEALEHSLGRRDHRLIGIGDAPQPIPLLALSPWRVVALDPLELLRWGSPLASCTAPRSLQELHELLGEPEGDPSWSLPARFAEGGWWAGRSDGFLLLGHLQDVLGSWGLQAAGGRFLGAPEEVRDRLVAEAWIALQRPDDLPAARLGAQVLALCLAAAQRSVWKVGRLEVDLKEVLGDLIAELLIPTRATADDGDVVRPFSRVVERSISGIALAEPLALRLCRTAVAQVARGPIDPAVWMRLTSRLYAWLVEVLGTSAAIWSELHHRLRPLEVRMGHLVVMEDVFDPLRFTSEGVEPRKMAVLQALFWATGQGLGEAPIFTPMSTQLRSVLLELAARPPQADLPQSTALGWELPTDLPDVALLVLFSLAPDALASLSEPVVLGWFERLERVERSGRVRSLLERALSTVMLTCGDPIVQAGVRFASSAPLEDPFAFELLQLATMRGQTIEGLRQRRDVALGERELASHVIPLVLLAASVNGADAVVGEFKEIYVELTRRGLPVEVLYAALGSLLRSDREELMPTLREVVATLAEDTVLGQDPAFARVHRRAAL
jgi:tetratricopeptide (TPR) repeat protein